MQNTATTNKTAKSRLASRGKNANGLPNPVDIHIGNRIRLKRQILGWSQEYLAQMLGITFQQVQKYEKAQNRISGSRLYDFASLLGVDVNFFYQDMPQNIAKQSPRYVSTTATPTGNEDIVGGKFDELKSERALKLLHIFLKINNPKVADKLFELLEVLSHSPYYADKHDQ